MTNDNMILDEEQALELAETAQDDARLDAVEAPAQPEPITTEPMPAGRSMTAGQKLGLSYGFDFIPEPSGRGYFFSKGDWMISWAGEGWAISRRLVTVGRVTWPVVYKFQPDALESALGLASLLRARALGTVPITPESVDI